MRTSNSSAGDVSQVLRAMDNQCWRVKLYQLEMGGIWNDQGTGFVSCEQIICDDTSDAPSYADYLMVKKEENNVVLLQSSIQYEDAYERQGETIIMWRENCFISGNEIDYALSFENTAGCSAIWDTINDIQAFPYKISASAASATLESGSDREAGKETVESGSQNYHDEDNREWLPANGKTGMVDDEREDLSLTPAMASFVGGSSTVGVSSTPPSLLMQELASSYIGLPAVCLKCLEEIKDKILSAFPSQKEVYASIVRDHEGQYFDKLLKLSEDSMVIEDITSCQTIAEIIRGIVYLNDAETLEMMVKNADTFVRVAGAMELDPLLQEPGRFKEALLRTPRGPPCIVGENFGCGGEKNDLGYEGATEKEHQGTTGRGGGGRAADLVTKLFRVRLLRDSLIRPLPDESGAAALNTMLCSLQSAVCDEIFNDTLYLSGRIT